MNDKILLTTDDLAAELGIAPATLAMWRRDGRGPAFVRIGQRLIRYRLSDVKAWVDAQKVATGKTDSAQVPTAIQAG